MSDNLYELRSSLQAEVVRQYPGHAISSLTQSSSPDQFPLPDAHDPQVLKDYFMISFILNSDQGDPITLKLKQTLKFCFELFNSSSVNKQELTEKLDSIIENEIQALEDLKEIKTWCDLGEELKQLSKNKGVNHEFGYLEQASINISIPLVDMTEKIGEGNELESVKEKLLYLKEFLELGVDAKHFVFQVCDSIIDFVKEKHNLDGIEDNNQRMSREEVTRSAEWIGIIDSLENNDEEQKNEIVALKEKFFNREGIEIPKPGQLPKPADPAPSNAASPAVGIYKFQTNIDESELNYQPSPAFASTRNQINVGIHYGTYKGKEIVAKIYNINGNLDDSSMKSIQNEIDVYTKLSEFAERDSSYCYIKCYGVAISKQQIKIILERYKNNLMDYIGSLKEQKYVFEDLNFNNIAHRIVYSFYHMACLGIYHQDIKPHNFLVDEHWNFRIIDFNVSYIKIQDATLSATGIFPIQGTEGYFSPEVQKMRDRKEVKKFNIEKSDVYSLGLVFYQLLTYNAVTTKKNRHLIKDIENMANLKIETKEFLKSMLAKSPKNRSTFNETLTKIQNITTTYQRTT